MLLSNSSTPEDVSKVMANQSIHLRTEVDNGFLSRTLFSVTFWPVSSRSNPQRKVFHDDSSDRTDHWDASTEQRAMFVARRKKMGVGGIGDEEDSASKVVFDALSADPMADVSAGREGSQDNDYDSLGYNASLGPAKYTPGIMKKKRWAFISVSAVHRVRFSNQLL